MEIYDAIIKDVKEAIMESLHKNGFKEFDLENEVTMPDKGFGDIACSIAFKIAKQQNKNPKEIAEKLSSTIAKTDCIEEIKAENGFINFYLDKASFSKKVINEALQLQDKIINSDEGKKSKVIIEYPSVNPNKAWHIGHLRNALIGDTISNLYNACNYSVEREDYINDMGAQVVHVLWGLMNFNGQPTKKYDHWLGDVYVDVGKAMKEKNLDDEMGKLLSLMEQNGTYEAKLAREMAEKCIAAQYETAFNYNIYHDVLICESDIIHAMLLEKALTKLEKTKGIRKETSGKYENCIIMDFEKYDELPESLKGLKESVKVLIRSNGTATYAAKDIAFHMWKFGLIEDPFLYGKFGGKQPNGAQLYITSENGTKQNYGNVKRAVNIIDIQQSYEQSVVKLAFNLMGKDDIAENIVHLAYNVVELESGALSGRKGTWKGYTADDLLNEARNKAEKLISNRFKLTGDEKKRVTDAVAISAIKFEMLRISPERKIIFSWEKALNFEGISGPYCQYTYARASRILENAEKKIGNIEEMHESIPEEEFRLIKLVSKCNDMVKKACNEHRSNVLTDYAGMLASSFSKFYEKVPVLKADTEQEVEARLALVQAFIYSMKGILSILGIEPLGKM